tara:strand:- start:118 stop:555 length:438 start_codon:yes stop_codon:yes gene_type:complete
MTFIADEMIKPPWNFSVDVEGEVNFTMKNLDKFKEPYGRLLLTEVDGKIARTISIRKIREESIEIKRMFVRPSFRGKKLGNLMIKEVVRVAKENDFSKLNLDTAEFMSSAVTLYKKMGFKETKSYPECIVPKELWDRWIFMMKVL